jgi:hypothetical protein
MTMPVDLAAMDEVLLSRPALARYAGEEQVDELGAKLAEEFALGGETPLWSLLSANLVEERVGSGRPSVDAVVLVRTVAPQQGATARFLTGFYSGLAATGVPAVGVETSRAEHSAIAAFARAKLSSVDDLDTPAGRLALAALVSGGSEGHFGIKPTAKDGLLPQIEPVLAPAPGG